MFLDGRTKALHGFRRNTFQRLSHNATVFVFLAFLVISTDMSFIIRHRMPITMFGRPRWSGPGRRFRYDFPALSSMIRGVLSPGTGTPDDR